MTCQNLLQSYIAAAAVLELCDSSKKSTTRQGCFSRLSAWVTVRATEIWQFFLPITNSG